MIQILLENSLEDTWVDLCQVNVSKDSPVFTVSVKKRVKAVQVIHGNDMPPSASIGVGQFSIL